MGWMAFQQKYLNIVVVKGCFGGGVLGRLRSTRDYACLAGFVVLLS